MLWLTLTLCAGLPSTTALLATRLPPCRLHSPSRCGHQIVCCSEAMDGEGAEGGEDAEVEEDGEATVYARKKGGFVKKQVDNRDRLPYELTDITPPERKVGTFQLAPNLGCGDSETPPTPARHPFIPLQHTAPSDSCLRPAVVDTPEDTFVVKRISYRYTYSAGRYRMTGKGASVVKAGRLGIEKALGRLLPTPDTREGEAGTADGDGSRER